MSIHLPAHMQEDVREGRATESVQATREGLATLRNIVKGLQGTYPKAQFIIGGDWNLDFHRTWVRGLVDDAFDGTGLYVPNPAAAGSFGDRLIDWAVTDFPVADGRVRLPQTGLDHRPVRFVYTPKPEPQLTITQKVVRAARKRGVTVLDRKDWQSTEQDVYAWRRVNKPHQLLPERPVDTIWQHITVTRNTGNFRSDVRTVERIGMERFGSGVSYNWIVNMRTGEVAQGQPLDAKGTHTVNYKGADAPNGEPLSYDQNAVSLAIAVLGMPGDVLSDAAEDSIVKLLLAHIDAGALTRGFDYLPHSHVAYKDCPCDPTRNRMDRIRNRVRNAL
jgi:hypothetical protein